MDVRFVTISDLNEEGTAIYAEAERGKIQFVVTRRGKPVALLRKLTKKDTGRKEPLTFIAEHSNKFLSEIEIKKARIIITRNGNPVLLLKRIGDLNFRIIEQFNSRLDLFSISAACFRATPTICFDSFRFGLFRRVIF